LKNKLFYNNIAFRVVAPLLSGILIYMLVLMFFDSVDMLGQNFFSRELLFVSGLSFIFFESNRLIIIILNKLLPISRSFKVRIIFQYVFAFLITIAVISLCLKLYFTYIEGFTTIHTELITFNSIFLFAAVFYHLYFLSLQFLYRKNEKEILKETHKKEILQYELDAFKNQVNPTFLFQALELIISELYQNKKAADELVDKLAKIYRYTLDNNKQELVPVTDEINSLKLVLPFYDKILHNSVDLILLSNWPDTLHLIPGTFIIILEHAISTSIVSESLPLQFTIKITGKTLSIGYLDNKKINLDYTADNRLKMLQKAYDYFSKKGIIISETDGFIKFEIPLLEIEEE